MKQYIRDFTVSAPIHIRPAVTPFQQYSVLPELIKPICGQLRVSYRVLNIPVSHVVLDRTSVLSIVRQLEARVVKILMRLPDGNISAAHPSVLYS